MMKTKQNNPLLSLTEYLFLIVCLVVFFLSGLYLHFNGNLPNSSSLIYVGLLGVLVAMPIVIFTLKKMK